MAEREPYTNSYFASLLFRYHVKAQVQISQVRAMISALHQAARRRSIC